WGCLPRGGRLAVRRRERARRRGTRARRSRRGGSRLSPGQEKHASEPNDCSIYPILPPFFLARPVSVLYKAGPARCERTVAMKLYPKIIPSIARDVIGTLMAVGEVAVETMRV